MPKCPVTGALVAPGQAFELKLRHGQSVLVADVASARAMAGAPRRYVRDEKELMYELEMGMREAMPDAAPMSSPTSRSAQRLRTTSAAAPPGQLLCPVSAAQLQPSRAAKLLLSGGQTLYFQSPGRKDEFLATISAFIATAVAICPVSLERVRDDEDATALVANSGQRLLFGDSSFAELFLAQPDKYLLGAAGEAACPSSTLELSSCPFSEKAVDDDSAGSRIVCKGGQRLLFGERGSSTVFLNSIREHLGTEAMWAARRAIEERSASPAPKTAADALPPLHTSNPVPIAVIGAVLLAIAYKKLR